MNLLPIVVALVAAERLAELVYSARNTSALKARGAVEIGAAHYPLIVLLHAAWIAALLFLVPWDTPPRWTWLGAYLVIEAARVWTLASLGRFWTTRIISLPGAPLVKRGPYRFVRHPNYVVIVAEIAVLPLAFDAWRIALVFSLLNLAMLAWRIRAEEGALAPRRGETGPRG
ncbi:MAG TPA: isoprenylcysteine carboxylmethyltransferase family protein [Stellaceae bacterium]|nr:isoprenylcysteine carboxylmethyltransferase family protein [Stellaceae bacterium]